MNQHNTLGEGEKWDLIHIWGAGRKVEGICTLVESARKYNFFEIGSFLPNLELFGLFCIFSKFGSFVFKTSKSNFLEVFWPFSIFSKFGKKLPTPVFKFVFSKFGRKLPKKKRYGRLSMQKSKQCHKKCPDL